METTMFKLCIHGSADNTGGPVPVRVKLDTKKAVSADTGESWNMSKLCEDANGNLYVLPTDSNIGSVVLYASEEAALQFLRRIEDTKRFREIDPDKLSYEALRKILFIAGIGSDETREAF